MARVVPFLLLLALSLTPALAEPHKGWLYMDDTEDPFYLVVETAEELEEFRKRLPEVVPSKKQPAPKNPDELRTGTLVDFSKERLLILARSETTSTHPQVISHKEEGSQHKLVVGIPEPPPEARPYGWGVYIALPLSRDSKVVKVEFKIIPGRFDY